MKVTIEIEGAAEAAFALHLAERQDATEMSEYFLALFWEDQDRHPDTRYCLNEQCLLKVLPTCSVAPLKHAKNPFFRSTVTTRPTEHCPTCGEKTVTVQEYARVWPSRKAGTPDPWHQLADTVKGWADVVEGMDEAETMAFLADTVIPELQLAAVELIPEA